MKLPNPPATPAYNLRLSLLGAPVIMAQTTQYELQLARRMSRLAIYPGSFDPITNVLYVSVVNSTDGEVDGYNLSTKTLVYSAKIPGWPDGVALGVGLGVGVGVGSGGIIFSQ